MSMLRCRRHGERGPLVVVIHGGPGAAGYMAPVARELSNEFRVIEPLQRGSRDGPLTVARHVEDLRDVLLHEARGERPALVGSSWGAMLALAFAAAHPELAGPLLLIGSGTFDPASRARLKELIAERMTGDLARRLEVVEREITDPDARLEARADIITETYCFDPLTLDLEGEPVDAAANEQTWADMLRLQADGTYPAAFSAITSPVLLVHGDYDPHPGPMVRDSLAPHVRSLVYRELPRCGHYPWIERHARDAFYALARQWLHAVSDQPRHF